jgi:ribosomal subunit interface protein
MNIQISGRKVDLGEALKSRIAEGLEGGVRKYFDRPADGAVYVSREGHQFSVDCNVHLSSGVTLQAHGEASDPYVAFEQALEKIEKRVRRYKRRLKDHMGAARTASQPATDYVLQGPGLGRDDADIDGLDEEEVDAGPSGDAPLVVAETRVELRTLTVSQAVMQLELQDVPALLFRNAGTGTLNLVYRRPDGHIGWVDPGRVTS